MKTYITYLLLIINVICLHAQPLDYQQRKLLLDEQIGRTNLDRDSLLYTRNEYVNGKLYYPIANRIVHPFFQDNNWKHVKMHLLGKVYDIEAAKYDIVSDNLVYLHLWKNTASQIYLNREMVKDFTILNHNFRYLDDFGESSHNKLKPGYYEVFYEGETAFYIRWEKTRSLFEIQSEAGYSQKAHYFLKKEGEFIKITRHHSFMKALDNHRNAVRSFMKKKSYRFNPNNIGTVGIVLEYYDKL